MSNHIPANLILPTLKLPCGHKAKRTPVISNGAALDVPFLVGVGVIDVAVQARTFGAGEFAFGSLAFEVVKVDLDVHCDEVGGRANEGTFLDNFAAARGRLYNVSISSRQIQQRIKTMLDRSAACQLLT